MPSRYVYVSCVCLCMCACVRVRVRDRDRMIHHRGLHAEPHTLHIVAARRRKA